MRWPSILALPLKRALARPGVTLLSLIGSTLMVGLMASIPILGDAVCFRILQKELATYAERQDNVAMAMRYYRMVMAPDPMTVQQAFDMAAYLEQMTSREIGLPVARRYIQLGSHAFSLRPLPNDARYQQSEFGEVRINCVVGVEEHIEIVEGLPFHEADTASELLVWGQPKLMNTLGLQPGDTFDLHNRAAVTPGQTIRVRIAGTWQARQEDTPFWYRDPAFLLGGELLTSVGAFQRFLEPAMPTHLDFSFWYFVLDESRLRFDRVDAYAQGIARAKARAETQLAHMRVDFAPLEALQKVQERALVLKQMLLGFSLPIIGLLLFFGIVMASIAMQYQEGEIAMLTSRGAGRSQILVTNVLEGALHILVSVPAGLLISTGFTRLMTRSSSFMTFARESALPVAIHALDWRLVALAVVFSLIARLLPAMLATQRTVVTHGRAYARPTGLPWSMRLLLDLILVAITAYAYRQVRVHEGYGVISWEPQAEGANDPLLFFAPTLFIFTVGILFSQVFPVCMRLLDFVGERTMPVPLYIGWRNLARQSGLYTTPLFLVIVCLSLGAFDASLAVSADRWLEDNLRYQVGADVTFTLGAMPGPNGELLGVDSWLIPPEEYARLPGVLAATRVGEYQGWLTGSGSGGKIQVLGVDRVDLARVAHFRPDYADDSLGAMLNLLAADPQAMLTTARFLETRHLTIGDRVALDVDVGEGVQTIPFTIVGTFRHFPTVYEQDESAVMVNLDYIYDQCGGAQPHSIWLRTGPGFSEQELAQALEDMGVVALQQRDSNALIAEDTLRPERISIYGNLSVGFLAGSLLACLGILLYTFASLVSRMQRFTILRAIGLRLTQLWGAVTVEYLSVIAYAILVGAISGAVTSRLFVPYFRLTGGLEGNIPPFMPVVAWSRIAWMVVVYFAVLLVAQGLVLVHVTRRKAFQALRLVDQE